MTGALLTLLLAAIVVLAVVAKQLRVPYPIVFVVGGIVLAFVPGAPVIELRPDLVFLLFLPPLIFGDGWTTDYRSFMRYRQPILSLAIGLVVFTTVCVAYVAHWMLGFPLALGFALGAILSPTDAVATDAIAEEVGLPRQLYAVISGESLVNDASGLVLYNFAVVAVVTGAFSLAIAFAQFAYVVLAGIAIGIAGAWLIARAQVWLRAKQLSDEVIAVSISLVAPFALYVPADAVHASGVLAALSGGMYLSRKGNAFFDADSRIAASAVWNLLFFVFNGAAFVLIGLQLRSIVHALDTYSPSTLAAWSLGIALVVVLARFAYVYPVSRLRRAISPGAREREGPDPSWQYLFVMSTAGMRGIVSLAAALALPLDFPSRDLILFVVFVVIVVTLVGEGVLLPVLIRRWNITETGDADARGIALAHVRTAEAVRERLRELEASFTSVAEWEVVSGLHAQYEQRISHYTEHIGGVADPVADARHHEIDARLRREAYTAERRALVQLRRAGEIDDGVYRHVEWQIDLAESRLE